MARLSDSDDLALLNSFIATVSANLAAYPPLVAADLTAFGTMRDAFADDLLLHNQRQDAARAQTIQKDTSRKTADDELKRLTGLIKAHGVSDADYAALGIPQAESSSVNATVPVATVDTSERLRHTFHFADASAPNIKRRPAGAIGLEIWNKIDGPPPGSEIDCNFVTLDTQTPHLIQYSAEHAGKTVHYLYRWQLRDGSFSAWGETVSATITG